MVGRPSNGQYIELKSRPGDHYKNFKNSRQFQTVQKLQKTIQKYGLQIRILDGLIPDVLVKLSTIIFLNGLGSNCLEIQCVYIYNFVYINLFY
jgi:hypothetical protein